MSLFSQTFSADKPIIFPDNWASGKTQLQLHEEWKATLEYSVYSNVLQVIATSLFVWLIVALLFGARQLHRLYSLDDRDIQKVKSKRYLKSGFLIPLSVISLISFVLLAMLLHEQWTRLALLKGTCFSLMCFLSFTGYKIAKRTWKRTRIQIKKYFTKKRDTVLHQS